ncbi:hypothetical protein [Streptomyces sp. HUAS TT20]|uniref:hypothetical protein n=1 Tax=Streptomyces sp. HUAS TT20 TaxID=3447509 RepID=UPI0021D9F92B|nr:hypothetical protein [Streptomyces sp. HUAS 15-9]UXY28556.1 hypothetical protein N8I87_19655 [Streptomyces sp. HUAS 15-9]
MDVTTNTLPAVPTPAKPAGIELAEGVTLDQLLAALPGAVDQAMRTALPGHYSQEVAERIAAEMIASLRQSRQDTPSACPVYRDCEDRDPGHYDHYNHRLRVTGEDGSTILDAGMAALSGDDTRPVVYLRNEDFADAAAAHAKTAELRQLLDQVDAMADRVFADHKASRAQGGAR